MTAAQYTTFTLRALGYRDPDDFTVATAETFGDSVGLHSSNATDKSGAFKRGAMAAISCYALSANLKDTNTTLADHIGLDFFTYPQFKAMVSVGSPKKFNEGRDINYEYKVQINMSLDEFDATGVEILTWNIKMLMSEYNTKAERTYYAFDLYVGSTEVGYAYGYPNGGCICHID